MRYTDPTGHWACGDRYDSGCAETVEEFGEYQNATYATTPIIIDRGGYTLVVMAPANRQFAERPEFFQKLGNSTALASVVMDGFEAIASVVPDLGVGDEDALGLFDIFLTAASSFSSGLSWLPTDRPVSELPPMITFSQDIGAPIADSAIAGTFKAGAAAVGGPAGTETVGSIVDFGTSIANGVYDAGRAFGKIDAHYSLGFATSGIYIIYYP